MATLDLHDHVRAAADSLIPLLEPDRLVVDPPSGAPLVRANPDWVSRALELLIRRALAGTPSRAVRLSTALDERRAVVSVEAPEGSSVPSGWAVRMATVVRIAEAHGGRLVLSDGAPSARFELPAVLF